MDTKRCNNHEILLREKELYHVKISLLQRVFSRNPPPDERKAPVVTLQHFGGRAWIQTMNPK